MKRLVLMSAYRPCAVASRQQRHPAIENGAAQIVARDGRPKSVAAGVAGCLPFVELLAALPEPTDFAISQMAPAPDTAPGSAGFPKTDYSLAFTVRLRRGAGVSMTGTASSSSPLRPRPIVLASAERVAA